MSNNLLYESIAVYKNQSGHVLIRDDSKIAIRDPNQYFNLHAGVVESINPETISNKYQVIIGENKTSACDIYLHWKWTRKTLYVVNKAWDKFPINGCYKPPAEITRAINSKKNEKINRTSSPQIEILPVRPRDSTVERTQRIREFVKPRNTISMPFHSHRKFGEHFRSWIDHTFGN